MSSAGGRSDGGLEPLGTLRAVTKALGNYNIAPDTSGPHGYGERMGVALFFGPGLVAEAQLPDDPSSNRGEGPEIVQILVSATDEDFAFPVLMRLCREQKWKMLDPDSGRTLG